MIRKHPTLPQLGGGLYLTDGGLETTLIFHDGIELPDFAAFHLLQSAEGEAALRRYFRTYAEVARRFEAGLVLETPTWRASADWGQRLGYDAVALADVNRRSVRLIDGIRRSYGSGSAPIVISGCLGPRGDGYSPDVTLSADEAEAYHQAQVDTLAAASVDLLSGLTLTTADEAIGITRAVRRTGLPVVLSFTVETDGRLPTGERLGDAIDRVDIATGAYPAYYMINRAHPTHFEQEMESDGDWLGRIRGLRANASCKSHAELDACETLDAGNPLDLARRFARLKMALPGLHVLGGCCGTDHRHIEAIARACAPLFRVAA
ncbi:MAG: homocysteine S-methyltransferase family protein [Acidobacteriota bacterium]